MQPLFSIITPSYNALPALRLSFNSVAAQAPGLCEYVIVDGASPDGTSDWLRQQDQDFCRWFSESDNGVYDAMNKGVGMARGQFLLFLGAGDILRAGILAEAARLIEGLSAKKPRFIYGDVLRISHAGRQYQGRFYAARFSRENICHQGIFYEKSIFDLLGDYDLKYPVYSDWAFNMRCFGDPRITKYYWHRVIADFEAGGLSDRVEDKPFALDHLKLLRRDLGWFPAFLFQLRQKTSRVRDRLPT